MSALVAECAEQQLLGVSTYTFCACKLGSCKNLTPLGHTQHVSFTYHYSFDCTSLIEYHATLVTKSLTPYVLVEILRLY